MFESVIERSGPARLLGRGALASVAMHAALLGGVIYVSGRALPAALETGRTVTFFDAPAPPPPPPPAGGAKAATVEKKPKKKPQKDKIVQAEKPVEPTPEPVEAAPEPEPEGVPGGQVGGVPGGQVGGTVGGQLGGTLGGTGQGGGTSVLPFGPGMSRPALVEKKEVIYTREAIAAKVEGLMLVRCVITVAGNLENCQVVKGLPHLEKPALEALRSWKYTPVTYQGRPVSVNYVISMRMVAP
jgi:protein TonB